MRINIGGIAHGYHLLKDGGTWCAVGPEFVDLVRSPVGFGSTQAQAVKELRARLRRDGYPDRSLPELGDFTVHGE
jgi:hypothetical protein